MYCGIINSNTKLHPVGYCYKLMVFERKVLGRIFGPTKEKDSTWRIKTNDEIK